MTRFFFKDYFDHRDRRPSFAPFINLMVLCLQWCRHFLLFLILFLYPFFFAWIILIRNKIRVRRKANEIIACSIKSEKKKACVNIIWPGQIPRIIGEAVKSAMLKLKLFSSGETLILLWIFYTITNAKRNAQTVNGILLICLRSLWRLLFKNGISKL